MSEWISVERGLPNFNDHGFHLGRHVDFKLASGNELLHQYYQGWGIFGAGNGYQDVTHWRPSVLDNPPDMEPQILEFQPEASL